MERTCHYTISIEFLYKSAKQEGYYTKALELSRCGDDWIITEPSANGAIDTRSPKAYSTASATSE
jgi:hypothetical protein